MALGAYIHCDISKEDETRVDREVLYIISIWKWILKLFKIKLCGVNCSYKSCVLDVFVLRTQYYFTPLFESFTGIPRIETFDVVMDRYTTTDFVRTLDVNSKLSTDFST